MKKVKCITVDESGNTIKEETYYPKDTIVDSVIQQFEKRSNVGRNKYGVTMDRNDLKLSEWLQHLQEELMDATLYVEKLKQSL